MPSFNPGTRVFAQLPNKTIWRVAKVTEPDPNLEPDPADVYVIFSGKSKKVKRNLKQVRLPPQRSDPCPAPAVDLTDDITSQQNTSNSLPSYSDPWDPIAPKPSPSLPSKSPEPQSELPSSPPARTSPPLPIQSVAPSSHDWLLSDSRTRHHANQTHTQVVHDPSLPTYSKHEFPPWFGSSRPPSVDTPPYPHAPHDQNFGSQPLSSDPHSFHSTTLRQMSTTLHMRSYPLSNAPSPQTPPSHGPSKPQQIPKGVGRSNMSPPHLNSPAYPARPLPFSSSIHTPQRNGLTRRVHDRHPFRSMDKHLPFPRTAPSRNDFRAEPRHPQSAFDDDVPIPRNIPRTRLSSSSYDVFSDHPKSSYPASKRQRLDYRYDMIFNDLMPLPSRTEAAAPKLSRRLAKREVIRHSNHWDDRQNESNLRLLPYQRRLTHEDNGVLIAPGFSLVESCHEKLPKATSDNETNILEEVFTGLSLSSAESFLDSGVEHPKSAIKVPPLAVRSGTRKKNRPKKLRALSHGERQLYLDDCSPAVVTAKEQEFLNDEQVSEFPTPKVFECSCRESDKQFLQYVDTIQCCRCSLWLHGECAGLETRDLRHTRNDLREGRKNFICVQCLDDHVSFPYAGRTPERQFSRDGTIWFSSIPKITKRMRGLGMTATDPWSHYTPPKERGCDKRHWLREPLGDDEKSARLLNFERLREGVAKASVGKRERAVLDVILVKGTNAGGI